MTTARKNDMIFSKQRSKTRFAFFRGKRKGRFGGSPYVWGAQKYRLPAVRRKWRAAFARYSETRVKNLSGTVLMHLKGVFAPFEVLFFPLFFAKRKAWQKKRVKSSAKRLGKRNGQKSTLNNVN